MRDTTLKMKCRTSTQKSVNENFATMMRTRGDEPMTKRWLIELHVIPRVNVWVVSHVDATPA